MSNENEEIDDTDDADQSKFYNYSSSGLYDSRFNTDSSANKLRHTYVKGYVDISGGDLNLQNGAFTMYNGKTSSAYFSIQNDGRMWITSFGQLTSVSLENLRVLKDISASGPTLGDIQIWTKGIRHNTTATDATEINLGGLTIKGTRFRSDTYALFMSDVSINGILNANNDVSFNSRLFVSQDVSFGQRLYVVGDASFNSNLFVGKDVSLGQHLYVVGDVSFNSNLFVGNLFVKLDSSFNGNLTVGKRLNLNGDASFNSNLFVGKDVSFGQSLYVLGDASFNSNIYANGTNSTFKFLPSYNGTNNPSANADNFVIKSQVDYYIDTSMTWLKTGNNSWTGNNYYSNDVSMGSRLFVYKDVSFGGNLILVNDASLNSKLFLKGDASFNGNLFLGKDASFGGNMFVNLDSSFNGNLTVGKRLNLNGDASLNSNLFVARDVSFGQKMFVKGDVSFNSNFTVTGNVKIENTLTFKKDVFYNGGTITPTYSLVEINGGSSNMYSLDDGYFDGQTIRIVSNFVDSNNSLNVTGKIRFNTSSTFCVPVIFKTAYQSFDAVWTNGAWIVAAWNGVNFTNSTIMFGTAQSGDIEIGAAGKLYVNSPATIVNDATLSANLFVLADTSLNSRLYVVGNTLLNGDLSLNSNLYVNGTKTTFKMLPLFNGLSSVPTDANHFVTKSYIDNTVSSAGSSILTGINSWSGNNYYVNDVSMNSRLFVYKDVSFGGNLILVNDASFNGKLMVLKDVSLNSKLFVSSDVSFNSRLMVMQDVSFNSRLFVGGNIVINGTTALNDNVTVAATKTFTVGTGATSLGGSLTVTGNTALNNNVTVAANKTFTVGTGATFLGGSLTVTGNTALNNNVTVTGTTALNGNVTVAAAKTFTANGPATFAVVPTSTATQPAASDTTTKIPTTAWVQAAIAASSSGGIENPFDNDLEISGNFYVNKGLMIGQFSEFYETIPSYQYLFNFEKNTKNYGTAQQLTFSQPITYSTDCKIGHYSAIINPAALSSDFCSNENILFETTSFSICFWVKFTSIADTNKIIQFYNNFEDKIDIRFNGIKIGLAVNGGTLIYTTTDFVINAWYHIGVTISGTTGIIYVNGSSKASGTVNSIISSSKTLYIASDHDSTTYLNILIDQLIFDNNNTVFTETNVSDIYNSNFKLNLTTRLNLNGSSGSLLTLQNDVGGALASDVNIDFFNTTFKAGSIQCKNRATGTWSSQMSFFVAIHNVQLYEAIRITGVAQDAANCCDVKIFGDVEAVSYNAVSDYRVKENVVPLNASFTVDMLNPVTYNLKSSGKQDIGFIAHEVQEFYPYLVNGVKDGPETQSLNYNGLIGILTKEIKDLKKEMRLVNDANTKLNSDVSVLRLKLEAESKANEKLNSDFSKLASELSVLKEIVQELMPL